MKQMCDGSLKRKRRLRFSHKSLSDWLCDEEKNESYHVEEREGHERSHACASTP